MSAAESSVAASRALDDLYRSHVSEVYRYAYAVLGNHADAEDVTQTTFVNALRALERGERPRKPSNWLITITHNIVRQRFRQQQARPTEVELDRDVAQEPADDSGPSMDELVRALQRIPQSQREALVMRELEGRPYSEIAQILELSTSALETLLFRARRSLADELENAVTCDRTELGLSKQLDGRLSRKERKRLDDHIAECPSCTRLQATQGKQRRAFKGLALLPLPLSLTLFKGAPSAAAAIGLRRHERSAKPSQPGEADARDGSFARVGEATSRERRRRAAVGDNGRQGQGACEGIHACNVADRIEPWRNRTRPDGHGSRPCHTPAGTLGEADVPPREGGTQPSIHPESRESPDEADIRAGEGGSGEGRERVEHRSQAKDPSGHEEHQGSCRLAQEASGHSLARVADRHQQHAVSSSNRAPCSKGLEPPARAARRRSSPARPALADGSGSPDGDPESHPHPR